MVLKLRIITNPYFAQISYEGKTIGMVEIDGMGMRALLALFIGTATFVLNH